METQLKSETARAIYNWYVGKFGEGASMIFDDPEEVERAIDLAIQRGARTASEVRNAVLNFLYC